MDEKHRELLNAHRSRIVSCVDVERIFPFLEVLSTEDVDVIRNQPSAPKRAEALMDLLPSKGGPAFHSMCLAFETHYPHLLTTMFVNASQRPSRSPSGTGGGFPARSSSDLDSDSGRHSADKASFNGNQSVSPHDYDLQQSNVALLKAELKLVTHDRDSLKKQLNRVSSERDGAYRRLAATTGSASFDSTMAQSGTVPKQHSMSGSSSDKTLSSARDYDSLKLQCDRAMADLQTLRRGKHRDALGKLETTNLEGAALRSQYNTAIVERNRLDLELASLQKYRDEQHAGREMMSENSNAEAVNQLYGAMLRKYEAIKNEHDVLRKRYTDLIASHSAAVNKLEIAQEEVARLKTQYDSAIEERNATMRERNGLKQQCTAAIMQWDNALREKNDMREMLVKIQHQHEEAVKEINQSMATRIKSSKDMKRLNEERNVAVQERNAALQEYNMVMSERESVHKEIEKLQDELSQANKKIKNLEARHKDDTDEVETLRREIASALHGRDKINKEVHELRERLGERNDGNGTSHAHPDSPSSNEKMEGGASERVTSVDRRDSFRYEHCDNLEAANQEIEKLRKHTEKLQAELQEAVSEADVCSRRRDWAFSERDKVVLERESIRTLCDKLRKERDRAVSELAESLRDSDEMKKQRNEASKELKEIKEKMEVIMSKERGAWLGSSHTYSRDSAIDTDLQECDTETVEIYVRGSPDQDPGFELSGGGSDGKIFISSITKGSTLSGKLRVNDHILKVNGMDCSSATRQAVMDAIQSANGPVTLVVRRRRAVGRVVYSAQLSVQNRREHGLLFETGVYVSRIVQGSISAREGSIAVGDRLLSVNVQSVEGLTGPDALRLLNSYDDVVMLTLMRSVPPPMPTPLGASWGSDSISPLHGSRDLSYRDLRSDKATSPLSLTGIGETGRDKATSPIQGSRELVRRLINSASQTEERVYSVKPDKGSNSGIKDMIKGKLDLVRGLKTNRERSRDRDEKRTYRHSTPSPFEQERDDALAQLDSVIDSFNRAPQRRPPVPLTSGGTWPKYHRSGGTSSDSRTGTIIHAHRPRKDRQPISAIFASGSSKPPRESTFERYIPAYDTHRMAKELTYLQQSGYASLDNHGRMKEYYRPKSELTAYRPISSPVGGVQALSDGEGKSSSDSMAATAPVVAPQRLGAAPSNTSLDYSVRSGNPEKEVLEYYVRTTKKGTPVTRDNMSPIEFVPPPSPYTVPYTRPFQVHSHHPHTHHYFHYDPRTHYELPPLAQSLYHSPLDLGYGGSRPSPRAPPLFPLHLHPSAPQFGRQPDEIMPSGYEAVATFPRKKDNTKKSRVPSNHSVTSKGNLPKVSSGGSVDRTSERGSPMSGYNVEAEMNEEPEPPPESPPKTYWTRKPVPGELRNITIEKTNLPLGIQIRSKKSGGIFVSSVNDNSVASNVGLQVGDQLLEVCGINMRNATYKLAANVLRQCGESITMLVQYSPDKYEPSEMMTESSGESGTESRSGSPTPCNSPHPTRGPAPLNVESASSTLRNGTLTKQAANALTRQNATSRQNEGTSSSDDRNMESVQNSPEQSTIGRRREQRNKRKKNANQRSCPLEEPRLLFVEQTGNLGVSLVGGNQVGIFVHAVQPDSPAERSGLGKGDQILEYGGVNLRRATAEQAAVELAKPADEITVLAQHNYQRYNEIQGLPGDGFYVRALFDHVPVPERSNSGELRFRKDDILYVDNTMYHGIPGLWRAWLLDLDGNNTQCGTIPSKYKVEEDLLLRRSVGGDCIEGEGSRRARRSFFRRKKNLMGGRSSSAGSTRDSRELASYSDHSISSQSEGTLTDDSTASLILSYQRVERLDYVLLRPVLVVGPLWEHVVDRLVTEYSDLFARCVPEILIDNIPTLQNDVLDCKRKGDHLECTTLRGVRAVCEQNKHCIVDISLGSVERLQSQQLFPIVVLIKYKSAKQIRDVTARLGPHEHRPTAKQAKEMHEHTLKLHQEFPHLFLVVVSASSNLPYISTQVKDAIEQEQSKTLWVPSSISV